MGITKDIVIKNEVNTYEIINEIDSKKLMKLKNNQLHTHNMFTMEAMVCFA